MALARRRRQAGLTLIELMIVVAVLGLLASIAMGQFREYMRRAKMSEVVLAGANCKNVIHEGYLLLERAPRAGRWGCESSNASGYVRAVETNADGVVRVTITNLAGALDGRHVHLVPIKADGTAARTPQDLGVKVHEWRCGSDTPAVRMALPATCRADTSAHARGNFR